MAIHPVLIAEFKQVTYYNRNLIRLKVFSYSIIFVLFQMKCYKDRGEKALYMYNSCFGNSYECLSNR